MIHYKFLSTALLLGTVMLWSSCSDIEEDFSGTSGNREFIINVHDMGMENGESSISRAVTDMNYNTTFEIGDCIGLFAVKDNSILNEVNNLKVELTREGWLPITELQYDGTLKEATYYAYFPYREDLSINSVETDFFASTVAGWNIGKDQSTRKNFADSDLMTSSGSHIYKGDKGEFLIQLNMAHRMSLAVISLPGTEYKFTNPELQGTTYAIKPSGDVAFYTEEIANDKEIKPYRADDGSYRMLVKPVEKPNIVGVLGDNKYEVNSSIAAGKYKRFMVDGGNVVKDYELKVGDYFCADGNLVSRDCKPEEMPDDCIGIVYYVGNPQPSVMYKDIEEVAEQPLTTKIKDGARDVLKRDYPNCVHGLVYALTADGTSGGRFGSASSYAYFDRFSIEGLDAAYLWGDSEKPSDNSLFGSGILGYNNTVVLNIINNGLSGGAQNMINEHLLPYREKVSVPVNLSTEWYLPSLGELKVIADNKVLINESLARIEGAEQLWNNNYWSSTYNAPGFLWWIVGNTDTPGYSGVKGGGYYRFSLAF